MPRCSRIRRILQAESCSTQCLNRVDAGCQKRAQEAGGTGTASGLVKSVVFSQFTSMLDIVCTALRSEGIPYVRVDGTMSEKRRSAAIDAFQSGVGVQGAAPEVAVMSLKAAGVGLNLTAASQVCVLTGVIQQCVGYFYCSALRYVRLVQQDIQTAM